jgi:L-alanine-DL-glutamate epimerase-like enolase superfamily enzyme
MGSYVALGYSTIKMKVGGLPIAADVERVRAVRGCAGGRVSILLDANQAYDVPSAIAAARAFEPYGIGWFEEPVHWYDSVFGLGQVSKAINIPTASGESELHRWGCRDLIEHAGIRIMQFDCTRAGGVTEWLKVAAYAAAHGVAMAPHHDAQIHGHLVAAVPNGHTLEVFPNPLRDPLWDELFTGRPKVSSGVVELSDSPGFGFGLNAAGMQKYAKQVC